MFRISCSVVLTALLAFPASAQTNPGAPPSGGSTSLVGCVEKNGGVYTLTDETSKTTAQLRGGNPRAGRHVQVTGTLAADTSQASGASEVLDVTSLKRVAGSCSAASGSGRSSFISRGTVVSIGVVGGVVAIAAWATISRLGEARGGK